MRSTVNSNDRGGQGQKQVPVKTEDGFSHAVRGLLRGMLIRDATVSFEECVITRRFKRAEQIIEAGGFTAEEKHGIRAEALETCISGMDDKGSKWIIRNGFTKEEARAIANRVHEGKLEWAEELQTVAPSKGDPRFVGHMERVSLSYMGAAWVAKRWKLGEEKVHGPTTKAHEIDHSLQKLAPAQKSHEKSSRIDDVITTIKVALVCIGMFSGTTVVLFVPNTSVIVNAIMALGGVAVGAIAGVIVGTVADLTIHSATRFAKNLSQAKAESRDGFPPIQ